MVGPLELLRRARTFARALWRRDRLDAAMHAERRFRISHDLRGLRWLDLLSLDARLAVRMLVKHRGLTLVGGFAMAVAIGIGAAGFDALSEVLDPALPLEEGARVVALRYATPTPGSAERRVLHDFMAWQREIRSVEQLGAFRTVRHNLASGGGAPGPVAVAEITASGFAVPRTPPLAGRYLLPADERPDAPPVVVIGHEAWRSRFAADPHLVGTTISLGGVQTTVVGVMPEGFAFPLSHQYWIPLRVNPLQYERLQGPALHVFGRLSPGVTFEQAQAELSAIGQRAAAAHPESHGRLRLVVLPYTHEHLAITDPLRLWALRIARLFLGALAFVVAVNLAILVYARTVARLGEIAVRTALGASRRRILVQLFVEALALAVVGAAAGLVLAHSALGRLQALANGGMPFWMDFGLSAGTMLYALGLAVLAAAIMGVLPGLKATGGPVIANLRQLDARTGARLGPIWTTLVVAQVGVAVAVLPAAVYLSWLVVRMGTAGPAFAADQFAIAVVAVADEASASDRGRIGPRQLELTSRLLAEPGVAAVTFSSGVPGFSPGRLLQFEDGMGAKYAGGLGVDVLEVGLDLFETYDAGLLAGRVFSAADLGPAHSVIVNRSFAEHFLTGSALGVRFRYVAPYERPGTRPETSYQIVGVVRDFPSFPPEPGSDGTPTVYHPASRGDVHPLVLSARFHGRVPEGFAERFRTMSAQLDPSLQVLQARPLLEYYAELRAFWRYLAWAVGLVTASVLLLSAAGMYAMMSFTVAQREREIAIRAALGAPPHRLVLGIFRRATIQLALGVLVGSILSVIVFQNADLGATRVAPFVLAVAATIAMVGLLAAAGPARRGLRIDASEVLKAGG
jgi:predicted permease